LNPRRGELDGDSVFAKDADGLMDVQESIVQIVDEGLQEKSFLALSDFGGFVKSVKFFDE
jgi:hypothetical protein